MGEEKFQTLCPALPPGKTVYAENKRHHARVSLSEQAAVIKQENPVPECALHDGAGLPSLSVKTA